MSRKFRYWSKKEEELLLSNSKNKMSLSDMAKEHDRTEGAIRYRLKKMVSKFLAEGKKTDDIANITGMDKKYIENHKKYHHDSKKISSQDKLDIIIEKLARIEKKLFGDKQE